jgi:hypothetical protein
MATVFDVPKSIASTRMRATLLARVARARDTGYRHVIQPSPKTAQ